MTRAAVYLRISSDRTGEELGVSRQRADCLALCAAKGWEPVEYVDNDISAFKGKPRPAYQAMLDDIADGRVGAVVAWDLDRLHRRPVELEQFMTLADQHHVALATVSGEVDLSTPQGRLIARLKGSVASHEVEQLRMRCEAKWKQVALGGAPKWSGVTPFGYLKDGTPDSVTAPLVRQAYQDVLAGNSTSDIARAWTAQGITGQRGRPWTGGQVGDFLRNPRNVGLRVHRGEILRYPEGHEQAGDVVRGQWTPLVDQGIWDAAMTILHDPGRGFGHKTVARRWLLTGVILCGKCGATLTGGQQTVGHATRYATQAEAEAKLGYSCRVCRGVRISHGDLEPVIKELVAARLSAPDAVDLLRTTEQHDEEQSAARREQRNVLTARLTQLGDDYALGNLDGAQVKRASDSLKAQLAELDAQERDHTRARTFASIPLGTPEVGAALATLSRDRFRAIMNLLMEVTIEPSGRRGPDRRSTWADPNERIRVEWK